MTYFLNIILKPEMQFILVIDLKDILIWDTMYFPYKKRQVFKLHLLAYLKENLFLFSIYPSPNYMTDKSLEFPYLKISSVIEIKKCVSEKISIIFCSNRFYDF